ncbi:MAG: peptide deformylase [Algiphilus sp.]
MALLEILHHPDPRLREKAQTVSDFGKDLQRLIDDMFETMYDAPGVGLAATQVGVALQVAVMDCGADEQREPRVMINPEIVETDAPEVVDEGCLSVPEVSDRVRRFRRVRLRALDRDGTPYELEADGLLAQCIQHEKDHLDGKLYIDHLSSIKRDRLLKRQRKLRKQEG